MGNHRADRRGLSRRPSVTTTTRHAGERVATASGQARRASEQRDGRRHPSARLAAPPQRTRSSGSPRSPADQHVAAKRATTERSALAKRRTSATAAPVGQAQGVAPQRRRAGSAVRGLPSAPILLGVAALAISAGGAVTAAEPGADRRLEQRRPRRPGQRPRRRDRRLQRQPARPAPGRRQPRLPPRRPRRTPPTRSSSPQAEKQAERAQRRARQVRQAGREAGRQDQAQPVGAPGRPATT